MANKKVKTLNVMNSLNGHNPCLVNEINGLFNHAGYANYFGTILHALAVRYKGEIEEKSGNGIVINSVDDALTNAEFLLMNICDDSDLTMILNFCYGDFKLYRNSLTAEINNIVKNDFNGRYKFNNFNISYFNKGNLMRNDFAQLSEIKGDSFAILDKEANLFFIYGAHSFPIYELERVSKLLKAKAVKTYNLRVYASREISVKASSIEEAKNMAKDIINGDPLVSADVDDIQEINEFKSKYIFSTNEEDYLRVLDNEKCTTQEIYAIYSDASCDTHLFDVLEDEFIDMLGLGHLIHGEGSYYFLRPLSNEEIKKYRKMFGTGFRDIFDKIKNKKC